MSHINSMNSYPLISVIIPMYNAEKYIERCLQSVMNQTYPHIEIIVVDDGSTDRCGMIVQTLAKNPNNRLKYFRKQNSGVSATRNYGLEKTTGDYFAFVDADDWIAPDMYEKMWKLLQQHNADLVMCGRTRVTDNEEICYPDKSIQHFYDGNVDMRYLSNQFDLNILVNKLYSRKLWGDLRLPENMSYAEDLYLVPDLLSRAKHIVYTSKGYYHYYENFASASFHLSDEKLQSDIIAKERLYKYMLDRSMDTTITFDWLFGAYLRGYNMGRSKYIYKQYVTFFLQNISQCISKPKCILFLIFPYLYFKIKK